MAGKKIICTDKNKKEYEVDASQLEFRPAVYGIVIKEGKVLLAKQWDGYDFPGGGINLGETIEEALKREVKEETGFEVSPKQLVVCENDFHKMYFDAGFVHSIMIYYLCEITGGKLSKDHFDAKSHEDEYLGLAEWIDLGDIAKITFYNPVDNLKLISMARELFDKNK